jgi:perosamine synthetase
MVTNLGASYQRQAPADGVAIPLCVPEMTGKEWEYLKECLDGNWVSSAGPFVERIERELAAYVGAEHGVATSSGTAALHVALLVAGVQPDDEVLVSTLTFIAPANAIRYCRAWPVFMDAEPSYWQMDVDKVADFLQRECFVRRGELRNRSTGRRVKAVLPVHILGHPVDMDPLLELARRYGLVVVEDATESLGARYKGKAVGHLGDVACFSFNGNKLVTAGGGGMVVTDNQEWAERARHLTTQAKDDGVEYIHSEIGYNYRLTNIQAALGLAQLEDIEWRLGAKRAIAKSYRKALSSVPGITPMPEASWASSAFWMYTILVNRAEFGMDSRGLLRRLADAGIQTRPLWQPLHLSRAHAQSQAYECHVAGQLYHDALSLPCSVGLTKDDQQRVISVITEAARG